MFGRQPSREEKSPHYDGSSCLHREQDTVAVIPCSMSHFPYSSSVTPHSQPATQNSYRRYLLLCAM